MSSRDEKESEAYILQLEIPKRRATCMGMRYVVKTNINDLIEMSMDDTATFGTGYGHVT